MSPAILILFVNSLSWSYTWILLSWGGGGGQDKREFCGMHNVSSCCEYVLAAACVNVISVEALCGLLTKWGSLAEKEGEISWGMSAVHRSMREVSCIPLNKYMNVMTVSWVCCHYHRLLSACVCLLRGILLAHITTHMKNPKTYNKDECSSSSL